ncbi:MAG: hypothetical protein ACHQ7N_06505 [Candidatus Methylomirabilales bacterium]
MGWLRGTPAKARRQTIEEQVSDAIQQLAELTAETVSHIVRSDNPIYEQGFPPSPGIDPDERKIELIILELYPLVRACLASWGNSPGASEAAQHVLDLIHTRCFQVVSAAGLCDRDPAVFLKRTSERYKEYNALFDALAKSKEPKQASFRLAEAAAQHLGYGQDFIRITCCEIHILGSMNHYKEMFDGLKRDLAT